VLVPGEVVIGADIVLVQQTIDPKMPGTQAED
jgi:hypothetical protein